MLLLGMADGGISILRLNRPLLLLRSQGRLCRPLAFHPTAISLRRTSAGRALPACTVRLEVGFVVPPTSSPE